MSACILLVDDYEINLATLEAILDPDGYEIHCVSDGVSACEAVLRLRPDLVLLDVMMPGMDGYEVCRRIRSMPEVESVPVIMVTALSDRDSWIAGIAAGADDFISKPLSGNELRARVRTVVRLNRARVISEQRVRLQRLFELAPSAILVVRADGVIVSANDRARLRFAEATTGARLTAVVGSPTGVETQELLDAVFATQVGGTPVERRLSAKAEDGSVSHWHVSGVFLDERAEPLALLSLDDITAEVVARETAEQTSRKLDELVRERTARLEEANRLLMSYTLFVAHDLRSPLSSVKCFLSMVTGSRTPPPPDILNLVNHAVLAAGMIEEMITDTLALAAGENAAHRPSKSIDPKPVIEKLCAKLAALHPGPAASITVKPLPMVLGTAPLLERIFFNLVSNALKYSAGSSGPVIEIGAVDAPGGMAIYVRDNGVGFLPEEADALFGEFSRLSTSVGHEGLGIGLSLVARLIHSHKGRIWAESKPGEGATFYVQLPTPAS
jgi:hypothetical protein